MILRPNPADLPPLADWKATFIVGHTRALVRGYFLAALDAIKAQRGDAVREAMVARDWRRGVDLSGVPASVVDQTDLLCRDIAGALAVADCGLARRKLGEVLDLW